MICPLKFNSNTLDADGALREQTCQCEKEDCELWNEHFGRCSFAVDSYLKGQADWRADREGLQRTGG